MEKSWEAWTRPDGMVNIQTEGGEVMTVRNDGQTGYGFALEYLRTMSVHYRDHLRAADLILRRQLGDRYRHVSRIPNLYNSNLALVSMNCAFGTMDHVADCDRDGNFHFEFAPCPFRATCPYNGYSSDNRGNSLVCCNPVYDTGLTPRQREVADLLVSTAMTNAEIADVLCISEKRVKNHASDIYAALQVNTRQELTLLLKDKRIY